MEEQEPMEVDPPELNRHQQGTHDSSPVEQSSTSGQQQINIPADPIHVAFSATFNSDGDIILHRHPQATPPPEIEAQDNSPPRTGIFTPGTIGLNPQQYKTLNHLLTLLTTIREGDTFTCISCDVEQERNFNYHSALVHARSEHGHLLGRQYHPNSVYISLRRMHVSRINRNVPVSITCNVCYKEAGSGIAHLIHTYANHDDHDGAPQFCGDCMIPIEKDTLVGHYNKTHSTFCRRCVTSFTDITAFLSHTFRRHLSDILIMVDVVTIRKLVEHAIHNRVHVPWDNLFRLLPVTDNGNRLLPGLFTTELLNTIDSISPTDSPLHKILVPYCDHQDVLTHVESGRINVGFIQDTLQAWRDTTFQTHLNEALIASTSHLSLSHIQIFEKEVIEVDEAYCPTCRDDWPHNESSEKCIEYHRTVTRLQELVGFRLEQQDLLKQAAILIGAKSFTRCPHTISYPVLNLSETSRNPKYTTGYNHGRPVVFSEQGNHGRNYHDYFETVKKVASAVGRFKCMLVVVEFFLLEGTDYSSRHEIYFQVLAFIAELEIIRSHAQCQFVVLPPIRRHVALGTAESYMESQKLNGLAENILSLVCVKQRIPVAPAYGEIVAHGIYALNYGAWTSRENENQEPLFNHAGTPTREFIARFGSFLEKIIEAWAKTIGKIPELRSSYRWASRQGGYRYPQPLLPRSLLRRSFRGGVDEVD